MKWCRRKRKQLMRHTMIVSLFPPSWSDDKRGWIIVSAKNWLFPAAETKCITSLSCLKVDIHSHSSFELSQSRDLNLICDWWKNKWLKETSWESAEWTAGCRPAFSRPLSVHSTALVLIRCFEQQAFQKWILRLFQFNSRLFCRNYGKGMKKSWFFESKCFTSASNQLLFLELQRHPEVKEISKSRRSDSEWMFIQIWGTQQDGR